MLTVNSLKLRKGYSMRRDMRRRGEATLDAQAETFGIGPYQVVPRVHALVNAWQTVVAERTSYSVLGGKAFSDNQDRKVSPFPASGSSVI